MAQTPIQESQSQVTGSRDRSVAELIRDLSEQLSRLIHDELRLAMAELSQKGKKAGTGVGLFGAAGVVALYGVGALLTAIVLLLALVMPAWAAALIVAAVLFVIAAVVAVVGRSKVKEAAPPVPEQAVESIKADVDVVKERAQR
jgi:uncharacterized membrane protein YqjE